LSEGHNDIPWFPNSSIFQSEPSRN
jgi:hypothetical protein